MSYWDAWTTNEVVINCYLAIDYTDEHLFNIYYCNVYNTLFLTTHYLYKLYVSLKFYYKNTQWRKKKTLWKKKSTYFVLFIPLQKYNYLPWWKHHLRFLSHRIPMLCVNFSKVAINNDFVNKSIGLYFEQICCTIMSSFSVRSWVYKKFGEMCFVLSHLI